MLAKIRKNCTPVSIDAYGEGVVSIQVYRNSIGGKGVLIERATPRGRYAWETIYEAGITPSTSADATLIRQERFICKGVIK